MDLSPRFVGDLRIPEAKSNQNGTLWVLNKLEPRCLSAYVRYEKQLQRICQDFQPNRRSRIRQDTVVSPIRCPGRGSGLALHRANPGWREVATGSSDSALKLR